MNPTTIISMNESTIEHNAAEALKIIKTAEAEAVLRIEAARVAAVPKVVDDHDTLIALRQSVDDFHDEMRRAIERLGNEFHGTISTHETRISKLESSKTFTTTMLTIGTGLLAFLSALLVYHITGK